MGQGSDSEHTTYSRRQPLRLITPGHEVEENEQAFPSGRRDQRAAFFMSKGKSPAGFQQRKGSVIMPAGMRHGSIVTKSVEKPSGIYMVRPDKGDPSDINPA